MNFYVFRRSEFALLLISLFLYPALALAQQPFENPRSCVRFDTINAQMLACFKSNSGKCSNIIRQSTQAQSVCGADLYDGWINFYINNPSDPRSIAHFNSIRSGDASVVKNQQLKEAAKEPEQTPHQNAKKTVPTEKFRTSDGSKCKSVRDPTLCIKFSIEKRVTYDQGGITVFEATNSCAETVRFKAEYNGCDAGSSGMRVREIESILGKERTRRGFGGTGSCEDRCNCTNLPRVTHAECTKY